MPAFFAAALIGNNLPFSVKVYPLNQYTIDYRLSIIDFSMWLIVFSYTLYTIFYPIFPTAAAARAKNEAFTRSNVGWVRAP